MLNKNNENDAQPISRRHFLKLGTAGAVVAVVAGVGAYVATLPPTPAPKEELVIGGTLPLTGLVAADGQRILDATEMAVDKINAAGGINGMQLKLIVYDDVFDTTKVSALYEKLITTDKADILISPYGAPMAISALPICDKYDKIMIGSLLGTKSLSEQFGGRVLFTSLAQPVEQGGALYFYKMFTDFLADFKTWNYQEGFPEPKSLAVVNENQLWGIEQHDLWKPLVEKEGWNVVVDEFVDIGATDFSDILAKIKAAKPDFIMSEFFFFRTIMITKQMREQRVTANFVAMSESGTSYDFVDPEKGVGPNLANGVLAVGFFPKTYHGGDADYLRAKYKELNIVPSAHEVLGYSSIEIIRDVVQEADSLDSSSFRKVLLNKTFETCYTPVKFDAQGCNTQLVPTVSQWINGELEDIWPLDRATAKPIYPYTPTE